MLQQMKEYAYYMALASAPVIVDTSNPIPKEFRPKHGNSSSNKGGGISAEARLKAKKKRK